MLPTWVDDAGMLVRGVNVRRDDAEREVWRPAGIPKTIREDSWVPLQEVELPGTGKCATFMISGHTLGAIVSATDARGTDRLQGTVAAIGIITGEPLRFDVVTPGLVRVLMRHERTVYLTYRVTAGDGSPGGGIAWQNHGTMPEMPALSIVPADETTLSEGFSAMSLSGTGATRGSLAPGDEKIVSDRVMNAYSRLKAQASATGFYIQPTLARCRMLDAAGDTIAVSPPVMIGATGGFQCTGDIKLTSSDGLATLGGGAVTARAYRIAIKGFTQMPQPWKRIVCRVIVETVPQIDPVDTDGTCSTTISTNGATTTVAVRLAGLSGTAASNSMRERNLTVRALTAAPGCYMLQGSFPYPFDNPPAETRTGLREDATAYTAKSPGLIPRRDNISFGAAHETCGELVLADRRIEGFKGYPPAEYAVGRDVGSRDLRGCHMRRSLHPRRKCCHHRIDIRRGCRRNHSPFPLACISRRTGNKTINHDCTGERNPYGNLSTDRATRKRDCLLPCRRHAPDIPSRESLANHPARTDPGAQTSNK